MSHKRELMTYVEYTSGFTCATVESRNRPVVGLGAFGGAMTSCLENLNRAKSCRLARSGLEKILSDMNEHKAAFDVINTSGLAETLRNETSMAAAIGEVMKWMKELNKLEAFPALCMEMLRFGSTLIHTAHQLMEWSSAVKDLDTYGKAIGRPADQPCAEKLKAFIESTGSKKRKRELLESYLTAGNLNRKTSRARGASSSSVPDFSTM